MPAEVISLLSSSEAGSPRPPQRAKEPSLQSVSILNNVRLNSDHVSAPAKPPPRTTSKPSKTSKTSNDVWLLSDEEDDRHQFGTAPADGAATKRRRLDSFGISTSSPDNRPAPTIRSPVASSRLAGSTADGLSNRGFPHANIEQPKPRKNWLEDDPFASSSPQLTAKAPPKSDDRRTGLPEGYLDDDRFESSLPQQREPKPASFGTKSAIFDDIDRLISSSPALVSRPLKPAQSAAAWDPISSSAPLQTTVDDEPPNPPRSFRKTQSEIITLDDSENDYIGGPDSEDDFPDITGLAASRSRIPTLPKLPTGSAPAKSTRQPRPAGIKAKSVEPRKTSLEKAREREEKAAARDAEKERKRLEKERAKEERAQDKARAAAMAEVNKIRTDKKVSTPEMIVDLPTTIDDTIKLQAETLLRDLDVHSASWSSPVDNVVKWRRKVRSRYNDDLGHWEPIAERIDRENYAMVIIPAAQFVTLVLGEDEANLESHVLRMKRHFPDDTIIYLIEGLELWMRKNRNIRNRQFVSAVRSGLEPPDEHHPPPSSSQPQQQQQQQQQQPPRRRKPTAPQTYVDEETIEDALLQLQVLHGLLIHHTTAPLETARWIAVFTQHISTVPYRRQRDEANDAGFCMETGQVRTGDGAPDTYVRMLQEIGRVTAPIAYGIAAEFGTVGRLVRGLEDGGLLRLEKVRKSVNKEGEASERTVGQAVSRRVYKIFTGRDETSTDI